ncbi:MAG TPA: hypothetical protein VNG33_20635 [Polyangiaceae bacterium]|nr:hypothetical protein [Polyangiaceae bacterium]
MGDSYQVLALPELGEPEVDACVERVLAWLWENRVVRRASFSPAFRRTNMSKWVEAAARSRGEQPQPEELQRTLDRWEAVQLARKGYMPDEGAVSAIADMADMPLWRRRGLSSVDDLAFGVEVVRGRHVQALIHEAVLPTCPSCGVLAPALDWLAGPLAVACEAWKETGAGELSCVACGVSSALKAWRFEPSAAFAALAFRFGNWPKLSSSFVANLAGVAGSVVVRLNDVV